LQIPTLFDQLCGRARGGASETTVALRCENSRVRCDLGVCRPGALGACGEVREYACAGFPRRTNDANL